MTDWNDRKSNRIEVLYGLGLFLLTVLSRVPFRGQILYHWDSVNFANGMRQFDMLQEHPQPPGYIVYVWLCRLVNLLFRDANATMVWISIVASGLAVMALYLLGRTMWNWRVGLIAALFLASSSLFWFYGEIALPHALDAFLVLLALWLLYRVRRGENRLLWTAVVVLGVAGGVRQWTLVFLLPVALYAVWRMGWRRLLLAGLLGVAVCLVWFVPLMVSCGGIGAYLEKMGTYSARFTRSTSVLMGAGWSGVAYNLRKLDLYTLYGTGAALIPLGFYGMVRLIRWHWPQCWGRVVFLGLWMAPALLFYSLIHMGQQGLIFVFLPVMLLLGALGTAQLARAWERRVWAIVAFLVFINASTFCLAPEYPLGPGTQRILTRETLVNSNRYYQERFAVIRERFSPEHTAIIAVNWCHLEYYLPEYTLLRVDESVANTERRLTSRRWPGKEGSLSADDLRLQGDLAGKITLLLFDPELRSYTQDSIGMQEVLLPHELKLYYLELREGEGLIYGLGSLYLQKELNTSMSSPFARTTAR